MRFTGAALPVVLVACCSLLSCSKVPEPPPSASSTAHGPSGASAGAAGSAGSPDPHAGLAKGPRAEPSKAGKILWSDPPGWDRRPGSNPMRIAEYVVRRAQGDAEDGECVVTTFGAGQGGTVDANVERWVRQFDPDAASKVDRGARDVAGMHVTTIEVDGTYKGMAMPSAGKPVEGKKRHRMIGAIVEAPSGMWFFKLTGPDATVKDARSAFASMLDSLKPGG